MELERHTDLRILKTKTAIQSAFQDMVCEMAPDKITVKELAERAHINRKTFYLHYTCIEALFEDMLKQGSDRYFAEIDKIPIPMSVRERNRVFFLFLLEQDKFIERLICAPSYRNFCNQMFSLALQHNRQRSNPYSHLSQSKQNIINSFLATSSLDIYRQWVLDDKKIPIDELSELTSDLLEHGISSIIKES